MIRDILGMTALGAAGGFFLRGWRGVLPGPSAVLCGALTGSGMLLLGSGPWWAAGASAGVLGASWWGIRAHEGKEMS